MKSHLFLMILGCNILLPQLAKADASSQAQLLFDRLAGTPIGLQDSRLSQMVSKIQQGDYIGSADIATSDDGFYNITLKHFFAPMSNRAESYVVPLNDFIATGIGTVRDNLDARQLLTGNYIYKASNTVNNPAATPGSAQDIQTPFAYLVSNSHYQYLDTQLVNLSQDLVQVPQQSFSTLPSNASSSTVLTPTNSTDTAGLLTTRTWANQHLIAGTNRRGIQFAFQEFLCMPITQWADETITDARIRQDVDRIPGGNPLTFIHSCRSCHGGMDALGGAYAHFDYQDNGNNIGALIYTPAKIPAKMTKNAQVYPDGHLTTDDSWINYSTQNQNTAIGWQGALNGNGIQSFGQMLSNSKQFTTCMATRVFTEVCRRAPSGTDLSDISSLASDFQTNGYQLKRLFQKTAGPSECLGR